MLILGWHSQRVDDALPAENRVITLVPGVFVEMVVLPSTTICHTKSTT